MYSPQEYADTFNVYVARYNKRWYWFIEKPYFNIWNSCWWIESMDNFIYGLIPANWKTDLADKNSLFIPKGEIHES